MLRSLKKQTLETRLTNLTEEYLAAANQLDRTMEEALRLRLARQVSHLENQIQAIEHELASLAEPVAVEAARPGAGGAGFVFISYKSQERGYALEVFGHLSHWGIEPWLDVKRLRPGDAWADEIDRALKACRALVAVMTPAALGSRFVTNEWDLAIQQGKLFLPLLFEPTGVHYKYLDIQYVDFTQADRTAAFERLRERL